MCFYGSPGLHEAGQQIGSQRLGMLPLRWILAALILASAAGLVFLALVGDRPPIGILDDRGSLHRLSRSA